MRPLSPASFLSHSQSHKKDLPMLSPSGVRYHFIIIGAGPQGLATGVTLLEAGHAVTFLEKNSRAGQGVAFRPWFNPSAITHSGRLFRKDSVRQRLCFELHELVER